ncbi:MAG: sulfate transporter [Candidatus Dactylopiibacterium carminicum]|uniref:Sulfate transporter n=1 Tax=Candidatus Dactylopiibacterium carminicum TaxID=857335 RepID=A0A272ERE9_9RHOO|nr:universal stress protein [Candidatus Dactylopiibacterium carminicum]KAF7598798.1 universal stress protein [Candidatus Dactylopiibacterium carminicum]PAS92675.1 MAG: sulfate transporter [Candidatus Dactylopiibacterium carminicum]PAS94718.1 MAG: sulfate transporter [Candidatus Dactylopiibacterium carminicum]PAS98818.1 MAG: sulfate transporter [Candidatus Dactylopiibacterium carminicum]
MFQHLLVPTDGSPLSQEAVARAASFAREAGARVTLFYASPDSPAAYDGVGAISDAHITQTVRDQLASASQEILDAAEACMREAGVPCERLALKGNKPWELIIKAASQRSCDLIFMASHGRRGVSALLLGSETQKVLTHSKIPVLVFR